MITTTKLRCRISVHALSVFVLSTPSRASSRMLSHTVVRTVHLGCVNVRECEDDYCQYNHICGCNFCPCSSSQAFFDEGPCVRCRPPGERIALLTFNFEFFAVGCSQLDLKYKPNWHSTGWIFELTCEWGRYFTLFSFTTHLLYTLLSHTSHMHTHTPTPLPPLRWPTGWCW